MYKKPLLYFIISLTFLSFAFTENYSIVFAYTGKIPISSYMKHSLFQARLFNKKASIFFIGEKIYLREDLLQVINDCNINFVDTADLAKSNNHILFEKKYNEYKENEYDKKTKLSYKRYSNRFFYIEDLANKYNLKNIFQIECDVMVYSDLSEMLHIFKNLYNKVAAPYRLDGLGSVSFVYFKNAQAINDFTSFFINYNGYHLVDMQILGDFTKQNDSFDFLPTILKEYLDIYPIRNQRIKESDQPKFYNNIEAFNSIFDIDRIGCFLTTKNGLLTFLRENTCPFNTKITDKNIKFLWKTDKEDRLIPYIQFYQKSYKINTLHISGKNLQKHLSINDLRPEDNRVKKKISE